MSAPDAAGLLETSKELDRLRKEQEEVLQEINKLHKKLQSSEFYTYIYMYIYKLQLPLSFSRLDFVSRRLVKLGFNSGYLWLELVNW